MRIEVIMLFIAFIVGGSVFGYTSLRNRKAELPYEGGLETDIDLLNRNYQRLEVLFTQTKYDLQYFVDSIQKDTNLLHELIRTDIIFVWEQSPLAAHVNNALAVYDRGIRASRDFPVLNELISNNVQASDALRQMHEQRVIGLIWFMEFDHAEIWINFTISFESTKALVGDDWQGYEIFSFRYIESDEDMEQMQFGNRRFSEGWYMYITPPPG